MNETEIRSRIIEILHRIAPEADLNAVNPGEPLREALEIDSFDFLNVVIALNEAFGVTIPESDYARISTLRGMTDYLSRL